ncbi:filamentous hemagglutinin N-terminal domain-containing protein [Paraburkholderia sp. MMS20-SJTN17]|uniref:Filamentous hemagglutinin N-terminal domain-containing protein n=1 Tax=Paraburkholderia translucens TaxID=2886945 RepID=A0ABS8KDN1_9BURK|nr:filamentous hemagglutinin N-terminal domain-containing protein [Paraburkholderia sp. MMS20-SJTN17]MCC8402873.1 filamentous hemagglutinin N-terminal domain-containing protein [Paraburkholderia sp. MMS20-SJTN17]
MEPPSLSYPILRARHRRQPSQGIAPLIVLSLTGLSLAHAVYAGGVLPQGGHYVAGTGTIANQGNVLTVTQPGSSRGVIDWNSFSIGKCNSVMFDNGSGATLSRVTGFSPSAILGSLKATGGVYLINPQGIVVGRSGVISTGGRFVASTLDLPDTAFVNGGTLTLSGTSGGKVANLGKISSSGGDVFLIAHDAAVNAGSISAPNGTAEYVVGQQVVLYESSSNRQVFVQIGSKGQVLDRGATQAAQINLEAADGNIYALAGGGSRIRATGTAMRDGHIWLVADTGHVTQRGTIEATNADGSGGTVDTLADSLTLAHGARVRAGLWNVSTPNFTVDTPTAHAFARSLNVGTSIDASATGTNGASGDMTVASSLEWKGSASLSLVAYRNVTIAPATTIRNSGSGNLSLRGDAASIDNASSVSNQGVIDWSGSTGTVSALYDMNGSYSPGTIRSNSAWTGAPYSGLVTQVTGYKLVNSLTDLQNVSLDLSGNYALGKDIDASATASNPGTGAGPSVEFLSLGSAATPFSGQFDGMGHVIDGFGQNGSYMPPGSRPLGLFGEIGTTGVVRNVGMTNSALYDLYDDIIDNQPIVVTLGILAGRNRGLITYAYATGFRGAPHYGNAPVGGLVGTNDGLIERSWSSANVGDAGEAGGLVGANLGRIAQSYATGVVSTDIFGSPGGLVGVNSGTVSQSYATGTAFGDLSAGGLVYANTGVIEQSFATGLVRGYCCPPPGTPTFYGGIAAVGNGTIANNVYWDKETTTRAVSTGDGTQLPASNGLTTAQMSNPASFDTSWDISPTGVWIIAAGATHPILRWQPGH